MYKKIIKTLFLKSKNPKNFLVFFIFIFFLAGATFTIADMIEGNDKSNFLIGTGGVTLTNANWCYVATPTPTLRWYYMEGFVPVTPSLYPPGQPQKSFQIQIDDTDWNFASIIYDSGWAVATNSDEFFEVPAEANLNFDTTYYWQINVMDGADSETGWMFGGVFKTPPSCVPIDLQLASPPGFGDTCNEADNTWRPSITWTGFADPATYLIDESNDLTWSTTNVYSTAAENLSITMQPNTTKHYRVAAVYDPEHTASSSSLSLTAPSACNPKITANPSANCDSITITWTASGDVTDYDVYRSTTNNPYAPDEVKTLATTTTHLYYKDEDIVSGNVTYEYFVTANATSGESLENYDEDGSTPGIVDGLEVIAPCQNLPSWNEGN